MTPRKYSGGTRRPRRDRRGRTRIKVGGGGTKKGGWCEFAIPLAAARTAVALGQLALVNWQIRGVR